MAHSNSAQNSGDAPSFKPLGDSGISSIGYAAPAHVQRSDAPDLAALTPLIQQVLNDPLLLRQLSDRVYELMKDDIHHQHDRQGHSGGYLG